MSFLADSVLTRVKELAAHQVHALFDVIEARIARMVNKFLRQAAVAACMFVGALCLLLAIVYFLIDVLEWPRYAVFGAASILLLLSALFLRRE